MPNPRSEEEVVEQEEGAVSRPCPSLPVLLWSMPKKTWCARCRLLCSQRSMVLSDLGLEAVLPLRVLAAVGPWQIWIAGP